MARGTTVAKFTRGSLIGDEFEVIKKLGEGGCGSVYRCTWTKKPDKEVAVKLLENRADLARFIREAKVLRRTKHINVVKLLGSGFHGKENPYIVLEYMESGSVRDLLDMRGKLPIDEAAWILVQAIRGLRAAKAVHRDLKPENLLITKGVKGKGMSFVVGDTEKGAVVKVADFGLAKQMELGDTRLTNSGQVMGTPVYMSPEQCRNTKNVSTKTDVYALGILFYEMVVGKVPFDANNAYDIMAMHCNDEPKFPRIDPRVKDVVARCLEKSPTKRYASLYAMERDLSRIAGVGEPAPEGGSGRTWTILLLAAVLLAFLAYTFRAELLPYWRSIAG